MINASNYISVNDSTIYYEISGNLNGEPLLMLHGGLGAIHELEPLHRYLFDNYQLISIDFRGHGKSDLGCLRLSYSQYQQDVHSVLGALGIEQYSIFGFSDGGIVGYRLAAQEPSRVSCLVTLGSQWQVNIDDPAMKLLSSLTPDFWRNRFSDDVSLYESTNPKPDFPKLVDAVKEAWFDNTASGYPCDLVEQIRCPTLIMRGDNDFIFSLDEAVALKGKISGSCFANIPQATHASHQEAPGIVGSMIKRFLSQHGNNK